MRALLFVFWVNLKYLPGKVFPFMRVTAAERARDLAEIERLSKSME